MIQDINGIFRKKDKIIIGGMFFFVLSLIIMLNFFGYFENTKRDEVLNDEFITTVVDIYIDYNAHQSSMIKLSNGEKMHNFFPKNNIELMIGDSLIKKKNSTDMLVFRDKMLIYSVNLLEK